MRQVLLNSSTAFIARVPRPTVEPGFVLVRVCYSMISVGTETAILKAEAKNIGGFEKIQHYSSLFKQNLGKAIKNPQLAVRRVREMMRSKLTQIYPVNPHQLPDAMAVEALNWRAVGAKQFKKVQNKIELLTDDTVWGYQLESNSLAVPEGFTPYIEIKGNVTKGKISIGLLDASKSKWIGSARVIEPGPIDDQLIFELENETSVIVMITNGDDGPSQCDFEEIKVFLMPPDPSGLNHTEMNQIGWATGYSAVGKVIAVGKNVSNFAPGDFVACAGANRANHADFISIPENLACCIPKNCELQVAAMTTIGAIALQGVRRASPTLGETVVVLGLGLLGQITVQLLRSNGCSVIGMDLENNRVQRALANGMEAGSSNEQVLKKLVFDMTNGIGVDRTLITASTASNSVINLAMELTRRRGTVVIVGDIGMKIERTHFYQKEIDLLMSTSYGPGRYDRNYEEEGHDYPVAYVRWTLNRNMKAFLDLANQGKINISSLIDRVISIEEAPIVYKELAKGGEDVPIGVLIKYEDKNFPSFRAGKDSVIVPRGHRKPREGLINYVLVGVGAFGTGMLVPLMERQKERFFLKGVVSRDSIRGGNYVRMNRLEILSTDFKSILKNDAIDLCVIATRHNEHAAQAAAALRAGKHVFVEKPLALTWDELELLIKTHEEIESNALLMVGFNRRFSPAMQILAAELAGRRGPLMINYRLNAGYIPKDHWIQTKVGGGRNIGEACHMYDCFQFLTKNPVTNIQASSIRPENTPYLGNDNFTATLTYGDGSLATLIYTALGPKQGLPKERIEIFCDGEAYLIDDFKTLVKVGVSEPLWQSGEANKGHYNQLVALGESIAKGGDAPIPFSELIETSAVALHVEDLLAGRVN